ncbi:MAG: hypothetical protein ACJ8F3_05720 [Xanthobacteraceae bacterium]
MTTLPTIAASTPQLDDDRLVPEELVGRLYRASDDVVGGMLHGLSAHERANLAMFCYRKSHLHRVGLAIAATCDLMSLTQELGTALGQALFAQSRDRSEKPDRSIAHGRSKITLATVGGLAAAM